MCILSLTLTLTPTVLFQGGTINNCELYAGVVFQKNVASRRMRTRILNPRILVLGCSLQCQRDAHHGYAKEQDATALLKAEEEWGMKCVERICQLDDGAPPDIVVCEGQVSTQVQRLLLEKTNQKTALLFNIKRSILDRLAKCINAEVLKMSLSIM